MWNWRTDRPALSHIVSAGVTATAIGLGFSRVRHRSLDSVDQGVPQEWFAQKSGARNLVGLLFEYRINRAGDEHDRKLQLRFPEVAAPPAIPLRSPSCTSRTTQSTGLVEAAARKSAPESYCSTVMPVISSNLASASRSKACRRPPGRRTIPAYGKTNPVEKGKLSHGRQRTTWRVSAVPARAHSRQELLPVAASLSGRIGHIPL